MASYHNIERSGFRHGEYVGWDCNGERYKIKRDGPRRERGPWWCYPQTDNGIPCFYAGTLHLVLQRLEQRQRISISAVR